MTRAGTDLNTGEAFNPLLGLSEEQFQRWVIDRAHAFDWHVAHFRRARIQRADGSVHHATPVAADGEGWPDLVLCDMRRVLFRELKTDRGVVSDAQRGWIQRLALAGADVGVWRPRDYAEIEATLAERRS